MLVISATSVALLWVRTVAAQVDTTSCSEGSRSLTCTEEGDVLSLLQTDISLLKVARRAHSDAKVPSTSSRGPCTSRPGEFATGCEHSREAPEVRGSISLLQSNVTLQQRTHTPTHSEDSLEWSLEGLFAKGADIVQRVTHESNNLFLWAVWAAIVIVLLGSLAIQHNNLQLLQLQILEMQVVGALVILAVFIGITNHSADFLLLKLALRYLVEGYLLFVALYIVPSVLGGTIGLARAEDNKHAAKEFVLNHEGGCIKMDVSPPLLTIAKQQLNDRPEVPAPPSSLPPAPRSFVCLLCLVRPALSIFYFLLPHYWTSVTHDGMITAYFVANVCVILVGLAVATWLVRDTFDRIVQYDSRSSCHKVAMAVGLCPLLGAIQDLVFASGSSRIAALLYLYEVAAVLFFVVYSYTVSAAYKITSSSERRALKLDVDPRNELRCPGDDPPLRHGKLATGVDCFVNHSRCAPAEAAVEFSDHISSDQSVPSSEWTDISL